MVKWTPKSESDLEEILEHISVNFTIDLAIEVVEEIINYTETTLTLNPLAGAIFEANPIFYKIILKGNTIYYCENSKDKYLYIVYVHARQTDLKLNRLNQNEVA
jgi:plasmid stabilization system protein ParE